MSLAAFIYPRTASLYRQPDDTAVGVGSYSGLDPTQETLIFSSKECSIQLKKSAGRLLGNLPADASGKPYWTFFFPLWSGVAMGTIKDRDVLVDDLGNRYKVTGDYWNSLGYAVLTERLES